LPYRKTGSHKITSINELHILSPAFRLHYQPLKKTFKILVFSTGRWLSVALHKNKDKSSVMFAGYTPQAGTGNDLQTTQP
jgi:hypothetical protein